jgi:hypothetical protein
MNRIKLSGRQIFLKAILALFYIIFLAIQISSFDWRSLFFVTLIVVLVSYKSFLGDKIEFDEDNMYIIDKDGEVTVRLGNIYSVGTSFAFGSQGLFKIKYRFDGEDYYARFYPRYFTSALKKFKIAVKEKNPHADVGGTFWNPY